MGRCKIEWLRNPVDGSLGYSINPVKGICPVQCSYCYARRLYERFHWDPTIRFDIDVLNELHLVKKPSQFFIGSTMEMFGPWVSSSDIQFILDEVRIAPRHTGIFLTKCPERLAEFDWPSNAWVGTTITNQADADERIPLLLKAQARVRFLSIEPMFGPVALRSAWLGPDKVGWVIIGGLTGPGAKLPRGEWVNRILAAMTIAHLSVWLKDNLKWPIRIQEYPHSRVRGGVRDVRSEEEMIICRQSL